MSKKSIRIELLHNFTFGKKGMEFFGLKNYHLLNYRIVYDYYTKDNIEKQYKAYQIDPEFMKCVLFIEPGVDYSAGNKEVLYATSKNYMRRQRRRQKRIRLVNRLPKT